MKRKVLFDNPIETKKRKLKEVSKLNFNFGRKMKYCYLCNVANCGWSSRIIYKEFVIYMLYLLKKWVNKPFYQFQMFECDELSSSIRGFLCEGNACRFFKYDNCDGFVDLSNYMFSNNEPTDDYHKNRINDDVVRKKKKKINNIIEGLLSLIEGSEILFISKRRKIIKFNKSGETIKQKSEDLQSLLFQLYNYINK